MSSRKPTSTTLSHKWERDGCGASRRQGEGQLPGAFTLLADLRSILPGRVPNPRRVPLSSLARIHRSKSVHARLRNSLQIHNNICALVPRIKTDHIRFTQKRNTHRQVIHAFNDRCFARTLWWNGDNR
jgi:hypothetical protein